MSEEKKDSIKSVLEERVKSAIRPDRPRDGQSRSEFLTRNTMRLIEKTYAFLMIMLSMFILVAIFRESIVEAVLPLFTLVIGGILGFLSKDVLQQQQQPAPQPRPDSGTGVSP